MAEFFVEFAWIGNGLRQFRAKEFSESLPQPIDRGSDGPFGHAQGGGYSGILALLDFTGQERLECVERGGVAAVSVFGMQACGDSFDQGLRPTPCKQDIG